MVYTVNFKNVETIGLEESPVANALAGLRANEARYFWNKYKLDYQVYTPEEKPEILPFIEKVLAEREMVFTKFYRGTRSNLAHGGTGLGLPIAREIARVHDGTIRIEDNSPHGARIVITLPGSHLKDREIPCGYENS